MNATRVLAVLLIVLLSSPIILGLAISAFVLGGAASAWACLHGFFMAIHDDLKG